jgi:hypothetical protein
MPMSTKQSLEFGFSVECLKVERIAMRSTSGSYFVRFVLTSVVISSDEHQYLIEA